MSSEDGKTFTPNRTETVGYLIEQLQRMDPNAVVRRIPANSSGVSESVWPREGAALVSRYGYVLPVDMNSRDGRAEAERSHTFPVVWL